MYLKIISAIIILLSINSYSQPFIGQEEKIFPKVNRIIPETDNIENQPFGLFYNQQFENIRRTEDEFHDSGHTSDSLMQISRIEVFSGAKALQNTYLPVDNYSEGEDPGASGWIWRFFGDNKLDVLIPVQDTQPRTKIYARWYHKFEVGFSSQKKTNSLPPKMARLRCFTPPWKSVYSILFWIEGENGFISIEQHTRAPGVEKEWRPNYYTTFFLNTPENIGRWIHFELSVTLGTGHHSDRIQAWADGQLICDIINQDLAGGYREATLNSMLWDCYWNGGSPRKQSRYFDDLVLSENPISPARTGINPQIEIAHSTDNKKEYQVEIAQTTQLPLPINDPARKYPRMEYQTVWKGAGTRDTIVVNSSSGLFLNQLSNRNQLEYNTLYSVRIRQRTSIDKWTEWSNWHATFATQWSPDTKQEYKLPPIGYLLGHTLLD